MSELNHTWAQYLKIVKNVVKPALGCTEPVAAALASALARQTLGKQPEKLVLNASDNLYKNSMGVFVPGTGMIGMHIAAAAGTTGGNADAGLEVLKGIQPSEVETAKAMIDAGQIEIHRSKVSDPIFCEAIASHGNDVARVVLRGGHTNVESIELNGETIFQEAEDKEAPSSASVFEGISVSVESIYKFATTVDFADIAFILQASDLNNAVSKAGLEREFGLQIGRTMHKNIESGLLSADLNNQIVMRSAAASDARMGGIELPAMSNYGSGNQGIAATMPIVVTAEKVGANLDQTARALIMSHLMAIYIKSHYPPLSAFCGNSVSSAGAACGMVYLLGGNFSQITYALQNMISDCSGMICDGAKASCAMKVATSSAAAVKSSLMALNNQCVNGQGIVSGDVEEAIRNIGTLVSEGMPETDKIILKIMAEDC